MRRYRLLPHPGLHPSQGPSTPGLTRTADTLAAAYRAKGPPGDGLPTQSKSRPWPGAVTPCRIALGYPDCSPNQSYGNRGWLPGLPRSGLPPRIGVASPVGTGGSRGRQLGQGSLTPSHETRRTRAVVCVAASDWPRSFAKTGSMPQAATAMIAFGKPLRRGLKVSRIAPPLLHSPALLPEASAKARRRCAGLIRAGAWSVGRANLGNSTAERVAGRVWFKEPDV
ncbi:MAG: hypothetical protein QOH12_4 [Solirubrobacteraceae bacterium]|jgi:hypothetical protein|nr:hypothetical protein [Solirubrobacteraceae bacterium]